MIKFDFYKKTKETKGITLIALVITIIVLLILAGVVVTSITSNEGVMDKAQTAKEKNAISQVEEQIKMEIHTIRLQRFSDSSMTLKDYVNELIDRLVVFNILDENEDSIRVVADKGFVFDITSDLNVIYVGTSDDDMFLKRIDKGLYIENIRCFEGNNYLRFIINVASDADIESIEYSICKQGENNWRNGTADSLSFKVEGLDSNTSYRFKVKIITEKRTIQSSEYAYTTKNSDSDASIRIASQNDLVIKPQITTKDYRAVSIAKWSEGEKDKAYFATSGNVFDAKGTFTITNKNVIHTIYVKDEAGSETIFTFMPDYSITFNNTGTGKEGQYQEYQIPFTGNYQIECFGAGGSNGNYYPSVGRSIGGVGAYVSGEFDLKRNDKLIMIVGQKGSISPDEYTGDGSGGGAGGGTFVTKQTGEATPYQITAKNNEYVTPLIVAAGGNSGNDVYYQKKITDGVNGSSELGYKANGFTRFLTSPNGTTTTMGSQTGTGGYGGASSSDDSNASGGGWDLGGGTTPAKSYNAGKNMQGSVASSNDHGKIIITKIDYQKSGTNVSNKESNIIFTCQDGNFDDWTNSLNLVIDYQVEDGYRKQYAIGNGSWIDYTGPVEITYNCTVKARTVNISTNEIRMATKEIRNIDTSTPAISLSQMSGKLGYTVTVTSMATVTEKKWAFGIRDAAYFATQGNVIDSSNQFDTGKTWGYVTVYAKTASGKETTNTASISKSLSATSSGASGSYQEIIIPHTGQYQIYAYGAQGSNGNPYNGTTPTGGKGAYVYGTFSLNEGDRLIVLVGQQGTISPASVSKDGAAGGGGGGTFVTKVVSSSSYYLSAKSVYVTPLIVAAGGNSGNDGYYQKTITNGAVGIHTNGSTSDGFTKFLSSPDGGSYSRGGQTGTGGYGGGLASDDSCAGGGGWTLGTSSSGAYSYNVGTNTGGSTRSGSGNGSMSISYVGN